MKQQSVIETARSLFYNKALAKFKGEYIGTVAAIPRFSGQDLNYNEIFIRDNVPTMIYLLLEGQTDTVRYFLDTCLELQSQHFPTTGIMPTSFVEIDGEVKVDYGQRAIGRVCSVDATLWWPILAYIYVHWTEDHAWATTEKVQLGLQKILDLFLHPGFRDAPTLYVPDGAFMIDRPLDVWGSPLEIQALLYGALKSTAGLIAFDLRKKGYFNDKSAQFNDFTQQQVRTLELSINWVKKLRNYLLKHYWINSNIVQTLRRRPTEQYGEAAINEYNIHTETIPNWLQEWLSSQGGYLIGNIRTGRPDFRFFSLGNCLGAIFDIISNAQQRSFFRLVVGNKEQLLSEMPLRICHPPIEDIDWKSQTGHDRKNLPWSYHNGGHWPCLFWFLVLAVIRQKEKITRNTTEIYEIEALLQQYQELLMRRLPKQKWAEYFDGPTGFWVGQQARPYQTWTIVGLLIAHHFLSVNPEDAKVMNLPNLRFLHDLSLML